MATWQLQEAKAKLSEVIASAHSSGPQIITRRGVKEAVIVSMDEYERSQKHKTNGLASEEERKERVLAFLQSAPPFDVPERHPRRKRKSLR
ncbi:type II toxin-antitoxin system Phd/YefM family antitoxin [Granulicella mallensis]|uniref:Antitoxin n=1 Tax=Granulicella mallensis (strain ATCC BAA-1857 / DSM 23137 / MP5ACTX8) TaxID=682795 RepID=G8NYX9_GRAMM|nr:type II toxin-antitoxin system Phd/YefM family antitoxin [Granulicella mallensis]AEU35631.1 prevent-host-death family protein [Granulicella mallensis MP5ACTX8]